MNTHRIIIVAASILLLLIFMKVNSILPSDEKVLGMHYGKDWRGHDIILDKSLENEATSSGLIKATIIHEMWHSLVAMRLYDYDIPTASAVGYYKEWAEDGTLSDHSKLSFFNNGFNSNDQSKRCNEILFKYRGKQQIEDIESYNDGAYIAGVLAKVFGKSQDQAIRYIAFVSIGLDHDLAVELSPKQDVLNVLTSLKRADYMIINTEALNNDISKLNNKSESDLQVISNYMDFLKNNYELKFLVKTTDTVLYRDGIHKIGGR